MCPQYTDAPTVGYLTIKLLNSTGTNALTGVQQDHVCTYIRTEGCTFVCTYPGMQNRKTICPRMPASVAHLDGPSDWRPGGRGFNPRRGRQHTFVEIDHEIFSTVILSLLLIQEGQLSVSCERMCTHNTG